MADSAMDKTILADFTSESLILVDECIELLESIENDPSEVERLKDFANRIDRVMGGAKSLALMAPPDHPLNLIGDYCAICKSVGYQGAQIQDNDQFYNVVVALLLDAVEMTQVLFAKLDSTIPELKKMFSTTFLERLKWISFQYDELEKKRSGSQKMAQNEIDALLKKLGL
jgi:hypothetical protein